MRQDNIRYIPSLGKVGPECNNAAAESSFVGAVRIITERNSEHVVDLEPVRGIARPLRPRIASTVMVECVHVNLVLQQQHTIDYSINQSITQTVAMPYCCSASATGSRYENGSPFLDGSRGLWVTASEHLTHDDEIIDRSSLQF